MRYEFYTDEPWLDLRKNYISATGMSAVLGIDPYTTPNLIFKQKRLNYIDKFEPNSYVHLGNILEPVVITAANEMLGLDFHPLSSSPNARVCYTRDDIKICATPDAINDNGVLLECKTTLPHNLLTWSTIPSLKYLAQLYTQMLCTESELGYLVVLGTNLTQRRTEKIVWPAVIYSLTLDDKLTKIIEEQANKFWNHTGKVLYRNKDVASEVTLRLILATRKVK